MPRFPLHGSSPFPLVFTILGLLVFDADAQAQSPSDVAASAQSFSRTIAPFLQAHCVKCHSGEKAKSDLRLERFTDARSMVKDRKTWETVLIRVKDGDMPPEDRPQPKPEEAKAFLEQAEVILSTLECADPRDPGRVTMRRLNRLEYDNTIRDLLGVEFRASENFPSDDVGYGFDNIGDVLTLPPLLLEKYLDAAAEILDQAIATPEGSGPRDIVLLKALKTLPSNGEVAVEFQPDREGEFIFKVSAAAQQAGSELAKMTLKLDDQPLKTFEVRGRRSASAEYEHRIKLTPDKKHKLAAAFINDFYDASNPDPRRRDRNLYIEGIKLRGPFRAKPAKPTAIQERLFAPGKGLRAPESFRAILAPFAERAFRRPATKDEVDRLTALAVKVHKDGASSVKATQVAMQAVLTSPHFLFKVESVPGGAPRSLVGSPAILPISDYELATRLSYFLWSSMPDDELLRSAKAGELRRPEVLESQARRMLKDPKASSFAQSFASQWLQTRRLETVSFDRRLFPSFGPTLRDAMGRETELFFEHVMREDKSVLDFIDGPYTFVNEELAKHYQIPDVKGEEYRRVELKDGHRGGVLTQGSILAVTSNPTRTSPVKRGKFILEQLLGTPPPPPPPDVPEFREDRQARMNGSLRQRMERHRADPSCATCHAKMDPLGFGMENFDAIGAWRDREDSNPIDASGVLPDGRKFNGPAELRKILRGQEERFRKCLAEKMMIYALGRGLDNDDLCVINVIADAVAQDGHRFSRLVIEIIKSDPFRKRKLEG